MGIIMLSVLFSISLVLSSTGTQNLVQSNNLRESHEARLAAESGLAYLAHIIPQISLSGSDTQTILDELAAGLSSHLGGGLSYNGSVALFSSIQPDENGGAFVAQLSINVDDEIVLAVTGSKGEAVRNVSVAFGISGGSGVFDYGVLLGGKLDLTGNASIEGANSTDEANVLSIVMSTDEVFDLTGNANIQGDLYASNPDGYASISGNVSIGGASRWSGDIDDHIHFGEPVVELPRVDTSVYEPFAVNTLSGSTNGNKTFTNIRIPAGTNPTFAGNITLKGVIYIEAPNQVKFSGNLDITGVVVTEDAGESDYATNTIQFTGNSSFRGVEDLPDTAEFATLRTMPGGAILAPGFGMKFTGNFGTVGGTLAAEQFTFVGNAGGVVKGAVLSYSDEPFKLTGNASLIIDRSEYDKVPPGFSTGTSLAPIMNSYSEE